jgi:protein-disulfide isomerase/uncharacterized membrane protein
MSLRRFSRLIGLVVGVVGVCLTLFLTWAHFADALGMICTEGGGCSTVLTSSYSQFMGLPTAFYGFVYYLVITLLLVVYPYFAQDSQHRLLTTILGLNGAALTVSLLLTGYSAVGLNEFCGYCLTSTALVALLFALSLFWTIRRTRMQSPDRPFEAFWKVSAGVLLVGLVITGGLYYQSLSAPVSKTNSTTELRALASEPKAIGNPNAPIRVVEFFDLGCPYCQNFTLNVFPRIHENYINEGKVVWIFRDFPIPRSHPHALYAHAMLSRIPPNQYLDAKKRIMSDASQWSAKNNDSPEPYFNFFMKRYGISSSPPSEALTRQIINRRNILGRLGVSATPSFLVNGKLYRGGRGYNGWKNIFDTILRKSPRQ